MSLRPFNRGTSILAALVFVAILGVVALGVSALSPANPRGQTAQAAATQTGTKTATQKPDACLAARNEAAAQNAAMANPAKTYTASKQSPDVFDPCVGAVFDTTKTDRNPSDPNSYKCVGKSAVVSMKDGQVVDKSTPNPAVPAGQCKTMACEPGANGKMNCFEATLSGGLRASSLATTLGGGNEGITPFSLDSSKNSFFDSSGLPKDLNTTYAMDQAFADQKSTTQSDLADVNKQISSLDTQLNQLATGTCPDANQTCYEQNSQEMQALQAQKEALIAKQNELQNQMRGLSNPDKQATLTADQNPSNPSNPSTPVTPTHCGSSACADQQQGVYDAPDHSYPSSAAGQTVECYDNGTTCYPANEKDASILQSKGYTCTGEQNGNDAVCTYKGNSTIGGGSPRPGGNTPNPGPGETPSTGGGLGKGLESMLGNFLKGFAQGLSRSAQSSAPACSSDPNAYAQQQQQYNMQLQQYNLQLQQYNMQSQYAQMNGLTPPPPPQPPVACQPNSSSNTCSAAPAQPTTACQGTWKPIQTQQSNGASCTTGWQCVPTSSTPPTAQISCQPLVADVGMSIAISYTCGNATGSAGLGFDTQNATSGATSTIIANPPQGTNTANFGVQCLNGSLSANAQCSVQIGRASIVLVATPRTIAPNASSTIGWVTSGMQSCVISSPTLPDFTTQNATNTSVTGAVVSPMLSTTTSFVLGCTTVGGSTRQATTTVIVSATSTSQ